MTIGQKDDGLDIVDEVTNGVSELIDRVAEVPTTLIDSALNGAAKEDSSQDAPLQTPVEKRRGEPDQVDLVLDTIDSASKIESVAAKMVKQNPGSSVDGDSTTEIGTLSE
jgi:hypothetical protein